LYIPGERSAFYLGAAGPLLGALVLWRWLGVERCMPREISAPMPGRRHRHLLSFGTAWCQGFLEGGMLAFLSSYLMYRGLSAPVAGGMMGVTMIGVILFQVPVAWIADRYGRLPMLLGSYAVVLATLALVPCCRGLLPLGICLFAFGAFSGAMYPLGLSLLGEGLSESSLARAYAWYLAMECVGSLIGAAAMGGARDLWGQSAMFAVGVAAVAAVLAAWIGLGLIRRLPTATAPAQKTGRPQHAA
jgi:MFS family permease